jgi:hypothetical protein
MEGTDNIPTGEGENLLPRAEQEELNGLRIIQVKEGREFTDEEKRRFLVLASMEDRAKAIRLERN